MQKLGICALGLSLGSWLLACSVEKGPRPAKGSLTQAVALCPDGYRAVGTVEGECKYEPRGNNSAKNQFVRAHCTRGPNPLLGCVVNGECVYKEGTGFPQCKAPAENAPGQGCGTAAPLALKESLLFHDPRANCNAWTQAEMDQTCKDNLDSIIFRWCSAAGRGATYKDVTAQCCQAAPGGDGDGDGDGDQEGSVSEETDAGVSDEDASGATAADAGGVSEEGAGVAMEADAGGVSDEDAGLKLD